MAYPATYGPHLKSSRLAFQRLAFQRHLEILNYEVFPAVPGLVQPAQQGNQLERTSDKEVAGKWRATLGGCRSAAEEGNGDRYGR